MPSDEPDISSSMEKTKELRSVPASHHIQSRLNGNPNYNSKCFFESLLYYNVVWFAFIHKSSKTAPKLKATKNKKQNKKTK